VLKVVQNQPHKILCSLIDPRSSNLTTKPRTIDDLYTIASNNYLLSFDNLSELSAGFQDAFCSISTGGAYSKRKNFSDKDESVQHIQRPTIISAINNVITSPDLLDRTITLSLPLLDDRKSIAQIRNGFAKDKDIIYASLLKLFRLVLSEIDNVILKDKIRMVDYQILGEAICRVLSLKNSFTRTVFESRQKNVESKLKNEPIYQAMGSHIDTQHAEYMGSVGGYLKKLSRNKNSPLSSTTTPKQLSNFLKKHKVSLGILGINFRELGRKSDGYHIKITIS